MVTRTSLQLEPIGFSILVKKRPGMVISSPVQSEKVSILIDSTLSGIVMVSPLQPLKANPSMVVRLLGNLTLDNFSQP